MVKNTSVISIFLLLGNIIYYIFSVMYNLLLQCNVQNAHTCIISVGFDSSGCLLINVVSSSCSASADSIETYCIVSLDPFLETTF